MARVSEYEKQYNPSGVLINEDGSWQDWNNQSGTNVQQFIKGALEDAIVDFEYGADSILRGKNGLGKTIVEAAVNVVKPIYNFNQDDSSLKIYVNDVLATKTTEDVNANSGLKVEAVLNWNLIQTVNTTVNEFSPNQITYQIHLCKENGEIISTTSSILTGQGTYNKNGIRINISKLFSKAEFASGYTYIKSSVLYRYINDSNEQVEIESPLISKSRFNVRRLEVSYPSDGGIIRTPIVTLNLSGVDNDVINDLTLDGQILLSNGQTTKLTAALDSGNTNKLSLDLTNYSGIIDTSKAAQTIGMCVRLKNSSGTLYSDYVTVNVLYQKQDTVEQQAGATVAISNVPNEVYNCDSANLFTIQTTDQMQGDITIYVYKSSKPGDLVNIQTTSKTNQLTYYLGTQMSKFLYKTIPYSLNGAEGAATEAYYSYLEMNNVTENNNKIYLAFVIQQGSNESNAVVSKFLVPNGNIIQSSAVRTITILNPAEVSELLHTSGAIIDYSQISTNNVIPRLGYSLFDKSNLHPNIDSTDGVTQDGRYVGFKVSPLGVENGNPIGLFKTPIALQDNGGANLASVNKFSIELLIKTYNVNNDDDFILEIGSLRLYPHYLRLWDSSLGIINGEVDFSTPYIASCANFAKDEITHIVITYDKQYKPTLYEKTIYSELYPGYEKSGNEGPSLDSTLKIYINGTINRSITINSSQLYDEQGNFNLQIHPTNSNINIYGFRTYNDCLDYQAIQKNRLSAFASLDLEKRPYLQKNNLIYKQEDYTTEGWARIYQKGLANTISIRKCLGIIDPTYNSEAKKKIYPPKNVMLIVTGDEGPLYYGNKKFKDPSGNSTKYHDATMFIKYACPEGKEAIYESTYNGKFIGIYQADENGYDEYYKAQGSSAKRYGGAYNVQFAKFYFIPENKLSLFANLVDNKYYSETAGEWEEENIQGQDTVYKTNVKLDFTPYKQVWDASSKKYKNDKNNMYPSAYNTVMKQIAKDSYVLPSDEGNVNAAKIKKLVGKVNYASSMQSHKQGACDLYAECYPDKNNDYMKRRAVKENVFYYFYIKLKDCVKLPNQTEVTFRNVTWDNIDFDNVKFFGIQTWGSAKMDKDTFGLNSKVDLEYLCVEGADNKNSNTNFKCPWAAMQIWDGYELVKNPYYTWINGKTDPSDYVHQFSGKVDGVPNYTRGLLINDETIMYKKPSDQEVGAAGEDAIKKGPDTWDIAGNAIEEVVSSGYDWISWGDDFTDSENIYHPSIRPAIKSINSFALLNNLIYTFDFGNLKLLGYDQDSDRQFLTSSKYDTSKKYIVTFEGDLYTSNEKFYHVYPGDVFRWDQLFEIFVPAGLYYNTNDQVWENLNLGTIYDGAKETITSVTVQDGEIRVNKQATYTDMYVKALENYNSYTRSEDQTTFDKPTSLLTYREGTAWYFQNTGNALVSLLGDESNRTKALNMLKGAFADMFKCVIWAYCDVNSFAYHQAAIRFLSGTDNRAKNIYFVLKGDTYKKMSAQVKGEAEGVKKTYYVKDSSQANYKSRHLWTLFQDDLDTIFATDNNGQQSKDYNLLEPIYNTETQGNWGDSCSGLWYNFDLVFEDQIKHHLNRIINWAIGSATTAANGKIYDENNNLYKSFLRIQNEEIPPVIYNHTSEIYYDVMQKIYSGNAVTIFGSTVNGFNDGVFNNNAVANPESLIHGGCFESEKQFLKKRVALLASYCSSFESEDKYNVIKPSGKSGGGEQAQFYVGMKDLSYIQDFYPEICGQSINDINPTHRSYADPIVLYYDTPKYLSGLSREGDKYALNRFKMTSGLTDGSEITHTDYIKTVTFTEGMASVNQFAMNNAAEIYYKEPTAEDLDESGQPIVLTNDEKGIAFMPVSDDAQKPILYLNKSIKNVEILNAPYAKFNKSIIDLSACQRLKELDLSFATSTTGISNIMLPKSNKLRRVTIPVAKSVTIEYYPGIKHFSAEKGEGTWFKFDSENVALKSITIDYRNSWALDFLDKYIVLGTTNNVVIKNLPDTIERISPNLLQKLVNVPAFTIDSKITIKVDGAIDTNLKAKLAEKWGNIDSSSNPVYITYDKINIDSIIFDNMIEISETGQNIPFKIQDEFGNSANTVQIVGNSLHIEYVMNSRVEGITIDRNTGEFKIEPGTSLSGKSCTVTVSVYYGDGSSSKSGTVLISFGAYIPKQGDIIYSDGSFSSTLSSHKTPIGFVFWSKQIEEDKINNTKTYDIRIMAFNKLPNDYAFGPSNHVWSEYDGSQLKQNTQKLFNQYLTSTDFKVNYNSTNAINGTYTTKNNTTEKYQYPLGTGTIQPLTNLVTTAITAKTKIPNEAEDNPNLYCGKYMTHQVINYLTTNAAGYLGRIRNMLDGLETSVDSDAFVESHYTPFYNMLKKHGLEAVVWPAFYYTYHWSPTGVDPDDNYIGKTCWYIPSAQEYSYLILNRIQQTANSANQTAETGWNATSNSFYTTAGDSLKGFYPDNVFYKLLTNLGATDSSKFEGNVAVAFLTDQPQVLKSGTFASLTPNTSESGSNNNVYAYYTNTYNSETTPSWKANSNYDYVGHPYIGNSAIVYPCCRIIKTISSL